MAVIAQSLVAYSGISTRMSNGRHYAPRAERMIEIYILLRADALPNERPHTVIFISAFYHSLSSRVSFTRSYLALAEPRSVKGSRVYFSGLLIFHNFYVRPDTPGPINSSLYPHSTVCTKFDDFIFARARATSRSMRFKNNKKKSRAARTESEREIHSPNNLFLLLRAGARSISARAAA